MIVVDQLVKRYGPHTAVDHVSFTAEPGQVTGFLGPNGSGKTTTMRVLLGLARATSGAVTVNGRAYAELRAPLREVGALLDGPAFHPARPAAASLRMLAATHDIPRRRVDEVLGLTGLADVGGKRVREYSLGMRQRLGIASALLGDPATVVLDEPANGLDPEGIRWLRDLVRVLADDGRTVLSSSHLIAEVAQTADRVVVLGRGRVVADESVASLVGRADSTVLVETPDIAALVTCLGEAGPSGAPTSIERLGSERLAVRGLDARAVGSAAAAAGVTLWGLHTEQGSLEDAYVALTRTHLEHIGGTA